MKKGQIKVLVITVIILAVLISASIISRKIRIGSVAKSNTGTGSLNIPAFRSELNSLNQDTREQASLMPWYTSKSNAHENARVQVGYTKKLDFLKSKYGISSAMLRKDHNGYTVI